jgi:hypothetical protein
VQKIALRKSEQRLASGGGGGGGGGCGGDFEGAEEEMILFAQAYLSLFPGIAKFVFPLEKLSLALDTSRKIAWFFKLTFHSLFTFSLPPFPFLFFLF